MALMNIDPSARRVMRLSSELATAHDTIRRQQRVLWGLAVALRSSQQAQVSLSDLLDELLAGDDAC